MQEVLPDWPSRPWEGSRLSPTSPTSQVGWRPPGSGWCPAASAGRKWPGACWSLGRGLDRVARSGRDTVKIHLNPSSIRRREKWISTVTLVEPQWGGSSSRWVKCFGEPPFRRKKYIIGYVEKVFKFKMFHFCLWIILIYSSLLEQILKHWKNG